MDKVTLFKVFMSDEAIEDVSSILKSGYIAEGAKVEEFEKALQDWLGNPFAAVTNTCTSALTMALKMSDVGFGDEVITTSMSCLATNQPILHAGAIPIWCDIEKETLNMDANKIEELITKKTKAIMCVHYGGIPCDMDSIWEIAQNHNLKVIEDCAHAWGSTYQKEKIGCGYHGDYACFSMGPIKHFNSIEGGIIACRNKEDYERAKLLRWYAHDRKGRRTEVRWTAEVYEPGYKFNMNNVSATVGLANLKYLDTLIGTHKANGTYYDSNITNPRVQKMKVRENSESAWWIYNLLLENAEERERFVKLMTANNIEVSVVHTRNDTYKLFEAFKRDLPVLNQVTPQYISIPVGWNVTPQDRERIVKIINEEF